MCASQAGGPLQPRAISFDDNFGRKTGPQPDSAPAVALTGHWLAGNEKMETITMGYIWTTTRIHSLIPR